MLTSMEQSESLAKKAGVSALFLKREDMTPSGSFKYRAAVRQVEHMVERGKKEGVISSSGNAAIALAREAKDQGVKLYALVSPNISKAKLSSLLQHEPIVIVSSRAMRLANYMSAHFRMQNLRPSVDDHAVTGFVSLGEEIDEQMGEYGGAGTVVSFMTSGASMLGMVRGYHSEPTPEFVAIQSDSIGKLGISRSPRFGEVSKFAKVIKVSDEDVEQARKVLESENLEVAPEAIASFAGIMRLKPGGNVVWVVSGKEWSSQSGQSHDIFKAESFEEVDEIYGKTRN